jgi:formylglycine-generating enzyme required for sulfatase activity
MIINETPKVSDARVIVSFTDRAGNEVSNDANETLTADWRFAGDERIFPLGNSGESIVMCWIPAGSFNMGSSNGEQARDICEGPVHRVTFAVGFWMGKYELTQGQWEAVMGDNPAHYYGVGSNFPVYGISWDNIQTFEAQLHNEFRLPSEAMWEYACRAGTTTRFYWGDDRSYSQIGVYAWFQGNSSSGTHLVGEKEPNAWGLNDMSGNVWEWCEDFYHSDYTNAPSDGSPWVFPYDSRIVRGGGWHFSAGYCRSANRRDYYGDPWFRYYSYLGFRLVRSL